MNYEAYPVLSEMARKKIPSDLVLKNCRIVNVFSEEIIDGEVAIANGYIIGVGQGYSGKEELDLNGCFVLPGLIDAHLHLESSMSNPCDVIKEANQFGTTTFIVDPHEAANVSGTDGIKYILDQTENASANVFVMAPSCVPSGPNERNGCVLTADDLRVLKEDPRILGLGEVMDNTAVIDGDKEMMKKLSCFSDRIIDGHAPFLLPDDLSAYALSGVATDHETSSYEYAMEEIRKGIHVLLREGSAARNLEDIVKGIVKNNISTEVFSMCTDDKHIEDIRNEGHISYNVKKAIKAGLDPVKAIKMATINAARCYGLKELGAVCEGYQADMVVVGSLEKMDVKTVFFKGNDISKISYKPLPDCPEKLKNTVNVKNISKEDIALRTDSKIQNIIELIPGQVMTELVQEKLPEEDGYFVPDHIYNKCISVERHHATGLVGVGAIKGYNVRNGAVGSTVAHDSHNMNIVGDNDRDILVAVDALKEMQGGYVIVENGKVVERLPLKIMGLMSEYDFETVYSTLNSMKKKAREMGIPANIDPFIPLSFIALTCIPKVRITLDGIVLV